MPRTGTGRIFQRGATWWIDFSFRGKRYRESAGSTKKAATDLLKRRMAEQGQGRVIGPIAERVMFEDLARGLLDEYGVNGRRSLDRAEGCIKRLAETFGENRALDITTDRLNRYILTRQAAGAANATILRELAILRRAFTLAVRAGQLGHVPHVPSVEVRNARQGFLDGEDLERVIRELPEDVRPVARFAALTGWRKGEILSLTWAQVDLEAGIVRLEPNTTKNREGREFPAHALPPLMELLREQREYTRAVERETGRIVAHVFHRGGVRIRSLRNGWDGACRRAGVPDAIFHDLRRTAVRRLEAAGVSRSVAMKLTGHKTEAVYRRYAIADKVALSEGVAKLAQLHAARPAPATVVPIRSAQG